MLFLPFLLTQFKESSAHPQRPTKLANGALCQMKVEFFGLVLEITSSSLVAHRSKGSHRVRQSLVTGGSPQNEILLLRWQNRRKNHSRF